MASRSSYLEYKQNTRYLLYWVIHTFNKVLETNLSKEQDADTQITPNTTGKTSVSGFVSMAKYIAQHLDAAPSPIYGLFQSVIRARSAAYDIFQQIAAGENDPEIEKSNSSHKHFIDALTEAFGILGGNKWQEGQWPEGKEQTDAGGVLESVLFANKFNALSVSGGPPDEQDDQGDGQDAAAAAESTKRDKPKQKKQARPGKGKNSKQSNKKKNKRQAEAKQPSLDDVPLESYSIVEDQEGVNVDYYLAVLDLLKEMIGHRNLLQGLWHDVAYDDMNSAVAGTVSKLAIASIQQLEFSTFLDIPGRDSFESAIRTITRGTLEEPKSFLTASLHLYRNTEHHMSKEVDLDVKEHFFICAYLDLVDFITDFQKTRTGKPTKSMLAEIRNWDPQLDLQRATKQERIRWRRSYAINWLYDLVNLFSAIVVQRNTLRGESHVYENVDWSVNGPWNHHRRLFGLNEFAGFVTTLAMQRPSTSFRHRIFPHHVFQFQCILDSLTVSQGWSLSVLRGHVLEPPPSGFRPRRDVDLFLDRENQRIGRGCLQAVDVLRQLFEKDGALNENTNRHKASYDILEGMQYDFINWLGESKYMEGLNTIPPSRFSNTNANGLWEYSPFLCGVGLMEGLELMYSIGVMLWDRMPEPMLIIHIHNMLVQKGYIQRPIGVYDALQELFAPSFFVNSEAPKSNFYAALSARVEETGSRLATFSRRRDASVARAANDIHGIMDAHSNRFFKQRSNLVLYRQAEWNIDRIPDDRLSITSLLASIRLSETKHVVDPETGLKRLENTELAVRARAAGMDEESLVNLARSARGRK